MASRVARRGGGPYNGRAMASPQTWEVETAMSSVDLSVGCRDGADSPLGLLRRAAIWLTPDRQFMLVLLGLTLSLGVLYAIVTRPFFGPDEDAHLLYVQSLWASGGTRIEGRAVSHLPTYYGLISPVYPLVASQPQEVQLAALRLTSLLFFLGEVILAHLLARMLSPKNRFVYLGTPTVVALLPGRAWMAATVNDDNLAAFASAALLYFTMRCLLRGFDRGSLAGLLLGSALTALSKTTAWPVLGVCGLVVLGAAIVRHSRQGARRRWPAVGIGLLLGAAFLTAVFPLADGMARGRLSSFGRSLPKLLDMPTPHPEPFVVQYKSFWMPLWSDDYAAPDFAYLLAAALMAVALSGLLLQAGRSLWRQESRGGWIGTAVTALVALAVWVTVILQYLLLVAGTDSFLLPRISNTTTHARYLSPAVVPFAYLIASGLNQFLPTRLRVLGLWILAGVFLLLTGVALFSLVSRFYWWP